MFSAFSVTWLWIEKPWPVSLTSSTAVLWEACLSLMWQMWPNVCVCLPVYLSKWVCALHCGKRCMQWNAIIVGKSQHWQAQVCIACVCVCQSMTCVCFPSPWSNMQSCLNPVHLQAYKAKNLTFTNPPDVSQTRRHRELGFSLLCLHFSSSLNLHLAYWFSFCTYLTMRNMLWAPYTTLE